MKFDIVRKFFTKEKEKFLNNKDEIDKVNRIYVADLQIIATLCLFLLFMASFVMGDLVKLRFTYFTEFIIIAVSTVLFKLCRSIPPRFMFYVCILVLVLFAAFASSFVHPDFVCVIILAYLVFIPILILDSTWRIFLAEAVLVGLYLAMVIPNKDVTLIDDEIIDVAAFTVVGLLVGQFTRAIRLENLELRRQSLMRETTDVLTGLNNRRKLFDYFIQCENGEIPECISGLAILDIDFFKKYNDTYGHLAGDTCLKAVGSCFKEYGEKHGMVFYRYGGEKFVAISHNGNSSEIAADFENICGAVRKLNIKHDASGCGIVTISGGYTPLDIKPSVAPRSIEKNKDATKPAISFQQILEKADEALYSAKQLG